MARYLTLRRQGAYTDWVSLRISDTDMEEYKEMVRKKLEAGESVADAVRHIKYQVETDISNNGAVTDTDYDTDTEEFDDESDDNEEFLAELEEFAEGEISKNSKIGKVIGSLE